MQLMTNTNGQLASLQSIMGALTYGVGSGLGSVRSGGLIEGLSPAMSYYIFATVSLIMAIYLILVELFDTLTVNDYSSTVNETK